ncbi:MAG: 50S ribosomal protein L24 [Chlamydiae bacterium]|nr:50S ribosomal protein L24 [Chlamydiota bacterium]
MKKKIRHGDEVVVITGNDKGKVGKVLRFVGDRVVVERVNMRKKHIKKTQEQQKGQIIDIECPLNISNVKIWTGEKAVKLRVRQDKEGNRELCFLEGKKKVLYRPVLKPRKS